MPKSIFGEGDKPCVVYGMMGTKSLAMTVKLCPSILNFCIPSAPALMRRSRCTFPGENLKLVMPALSVHFVVSPAAAAIEQLKLFLPWIKLLSEEGPYFLSVKASYHQIPVITGVETGVCWREHLLSRGKLST